MNFFKYVDGEVGEIYVTNFMKTIGVMYSISLWNMMECPQATNFIFFIFSQVLDWLAV
jgi:hypothetical protein